jgi:hypothetical protein
MSGSTGFSQQNQQDLYRLQQMEKYKNCLSLSADNYLKFDKIGNQDEIIKNFIQEQEKKIKQNSNNIEYVSSLLHQMEENYLFLTKEGKEMLNYSTHVLAKTNGIRSILDSFKNDTLKQSEFLEDNKKKINMLESHHYKINLPSQFFLSISVDLIEKVNYFKKIIDDYDILFYNIYKVI